MARTQISGKLIEDSSIGRPDINTTVTGEALITKLLVGTGLTATRTGVDVGTGDVTVTLNTSTLVTSFNSRQGAVTLSGTDVTTALGFTPISGETFTGTVTSVGLTSATSGLTIGSSPITTSGNLTLSIATAGTAQNGLLNSTDWNTFNGKQATLSGTGFVKISGTTITYDNSTYYLASNPGGYTANTGTVTSIIAGTGLSGGTITTSGTIGLANTTVVAGSYTSTNLTVDAQGRITAASNGTSGGGVTINNNVNDYLITASGTANTLNGEAGLRFNGTNLRFGPDTDNNTTYNISSRNQIIIHANDTAGNDNFFTNCILQSGSGTNISGITAVGSGNLNYVDLRTLATTRMRVFNTGNIGIGTTTDSLFKLDVNGSIRTTSTINATLANVSTPNVVYYNSTNGLLTYGAVPGGGGGTPTPVTVNVGSNSFGNVLHQSTTFGFAGLIKIEYYAIDAINADRQEAGILLGTFNISSAPNSQLTASGLVFIGAGQPLMFYAGMSGGNFPIVYVDNPNSNPYDIKFTVTELT